MTDSTRIQLRGICQCCGRLQAVTGGYMAKHGYTVKDGWFNGVCSGHQFPAMQESRTQADNICVSVRRDCVSLRQRAEDFRAGDFDRDVMVPYGPLVRPEKYRSAMVPSLIPFADAHEFDQDAWVKAQAWKAERRAEIGESFANDLEGLANKYHGTPLAEVKIATEKAPAIAHGEQRKDKSGVLTAFRVERARVYYKTEIGLKGWSGTAAWRRMELVG